MTHRGLSGYYSWGVGGPGGPGAGSSQGSDGDSHHSIISDLGPLLESGSTPPQEFDVFANFVRAAAHGAASGVAQAHGAASGAPHEWRSRCPPQVPSAMNVHTTFVANVNGSFAPAAAASVTGQHPVPPGPGMPSFVPGTAPSGLGMQGAPQLSGGGSGSAALPTQEDAGNGQPENDDDNNNDDGGEYVDQGQETARKRPRGRPRKNGEQKRSENFSWTKHRVDILCEYPKSLETHGRDFTIARFAEDLSQAFGKEISENSTRLFVAKAQEAAIAMHELNQRQRGAAQTVTERQVDAQINCDFMDMGENLYAIAAKQGLTCKDSFQVIRPLLAAGRLLCEIRDAKNREAAVIAEKKAERERRAFRALQNGTLPGSGKGGKKQLVSAFKDPAAAAASAPAPSPPPLIDVEAGEQEPPPRFVDPQETRAKFVQARKNSVQVSRSGGVAQLRADMGRIVASANAANAAAAATAATAATAANAANAPNAPNAANAANNGGSLEIMMQMMAKQMAKHEQLLDQITKKLL